MLDGPAGAAELLAYVGRVDALLQAALDAASRMDGPDAEGQAWPVA